MGCDKYQRLHKLAITRSQNVSCRNIMSDTYEKIPKNRGFVNEHDNQLYRRVKTKTALCASNATCNTASVLLRLQHV